MKKHLSDLGIEVAAMAFAILVSASIYHFVSSSNKESVLNLVRANLNRNEISSNPFRVTQEIENLEAMGVFKCSRLRMKGSKDLFLDLSFKSGCRANSFLGSEANFSAEVLSSNGQVWIFNSKLILQPETKMLLSMMTVLLLLLSVLAARFYKIKIEAIQREKNLEIQKLALFADVAKQVAHDIRSPLSALRMISITLDELSEDKRILVRSSVQRINDIANDLLQRSKQPAYQVAKKENQVVSKLQLTEGDISKQFIPALVDEIVSEKRMQYREYSGIQIEVDLNEGFGFFSEVRSVDLKRAISNLVNNSIEAFENRVGSVQVGVQIADTVVGARKFVEICIQDNGKGIPPNILKQLGKSGFSNGKDGLSDSSESGHGLGIFHAKSCVESFGGNLMIESIVGKGTTVKIQLPLVSSPDWFANDIDLTGVVQLVSLDDDVTTHQIWSGRLKSRNLNGIKHLKFQSGEEFRQFVNSTDRAKGTLYLIDFELLNQPISGLDLIEDLKIQNKSILVTSRYEDRDLQHRAENLGLKILPKTLAGFVPLNKKGLA